MNSNQEQILFNILENLSKSVEDLKIAVEKSNDNNENKGFILDLFFNENKLELLHRAEIDLKDLYRNYNDYYYKFAREYPSINFDAFCEEFVKRFPNNKLTVHSDDHFGLTVTSRGALTNNSVIDFLDELVCDCDYSTAELEDLFENDFENLYKSYEVDYYDQLPTNLKFKSKKIDKRLFKKLCQDYILCIY